MRTFHFRKALDEAFSETPCCCCCCCCPAMTMGNVPVRERSNAEKRSHSCCVRVLHIAETVFSTPRHPAQPVTVPILQSYNSRDIQVVWPHNYDTDILHHCYPVSRVDGEMPMTFIVLGTAGTTYTFYEREKNERNKKQGNKIERQERRYKKRKKRCVQEVWQTISTERARETIRTTTSKQSED